MKEQEKIVEEIKKDTSNIIDGISKLPYRKQIRNFDKSIDKLEESKEVLEKH